MQQFCDFFALRQKLAVLPSDGFAQHGGGKVYHHAHSHWDTAQQHPATVSAQQMLQRPVSAVDNNTHNGSGQHRPQQIFQQRGLLGYQLGNGNQIQHRNGKITQCCADGSAQNTDGRIAYQKIHDQQLNHTAYQHVHHRYMGIAVGLEQGIGVLDNGIKENAHTQNAHELTAQGQTHPLSVLADPAGLEYMLSYTTDDPAIATVDENGVVTAVGRGSATITVTDGVLSTTCTVVCNWEPVWQPADLTFVTGENGKYEATYPINHNGGKVTLYNGNIPAEQISFSSSSPSIATVDKNGVVTVHTVGTARITATYKGISIYGVIRCE